MTEIGYVRVSTDDQITDLQRDALSDCIKVFEDTISGKGVIVPAKVFPKHDKLICTESAKAIYLYLTSNH